MNANWTDLNELNQLQQINEESKSKPVLIFKHSTTCGISHSVLSRLEPTLPELTVKFSVYYLDLLRHRDISNAIAQEYNVIHQSPQVLLIENGQCVYSSSHYAINPELLLKQVP